MIKWIPCFLIFYISILSIIRDKGVMAYPELAEGDTCVPGQGYRVHCNTCRCGYNNTLICTNMMCIDDPAYSATGSEMMMLRQGDTSKQLQLERFKEDESILLLPALASISSKCSPNKKGYRVDCNKCTCSGESLVCTNYYCLSFKDTHEREALKVAGKACRAGDSINYECIKCECSSQLRLICQAKPDCRTYKQEIDYLTAKRDNKSMHIRDDNSETCIANYIYKKHCNLCTCMDGKNLVCTLKGCLTYDEVKNHNIVDKHKTEEVIAPVETKLVLDISSDE